jgi:hypothetical protein
MRALTTTCACAPSKANMATMAIANIFTYFMILIFKVKSIPINYYDNDYYYRNYRNDGHYGGGHKNAFHDGFDFLLNNLLMLPRQILITLTTSLFPFS